MATTTVKISALPAATSVQAQDVFVGSQNGVTRKFSAGLISSYVQDNLTAQVSAFVVDAEAAAEIATSAAAVAVAAAANATGFITVTSVSSAVTNAYQGNAPYGFVLGQYYQVRLPYANTSANPTLRLNGTGLTLSMRQGDGTASPEGFFPADTALTFQYTAASGVSVLQLVARGETDDIAEFGPRVVTNINGQRTIFRTSIGVTSPGGYAWIWAIPNNSSVSSGSINFYTGFQESNPELKLRIDDKGARVYNGAFYDRRNRQLYGVFNPPETNFAYQENFAQVVSPYTEFAHEAVNVSVTTPYFPSGANQGRHLRITASLAHINMMAFPRNAALRIDTEANGTAIINAGYTTGVWADTSTTCIKMEPDSFLEVVKEQNGIRILAANGLAYAVSVTEPTYGYKWAFLGQSWAVRESRNAYFGIQKRLYELVAAGKPIANPSVFVVQNTAFGASALLKGAPTDVSNYWWDQSVSAPGPNAIAFVSAVAATSLWGPALSDVAVMYGLNDLSIFTSSGTTSTPSVWTASQVALQQYIRSALGLPNLRFWICPLPSQQLGTFAENKWYAMRNAQLAVISADPAGLTFRGPDYYDYPRPYVPVEGEDRHHAYAYQADHGARLASVIMNYVVSASVYTGPVIVSASRIAPKTFRITFDRRGGLAFNRPLVPAAARIIANGDYFSTPLTVEPGTWTVGVVSVSGYDYDIYTVSLETDAPTMQLAYPYGSAYELLDTTRQWRALDPETGRWWPVATIRNP